MKVLKLDSMTATQPTRYFSSRPRCQKCQGDHGSIFVCNNPIVVNPKGVVEEGMKDIRTKQMSTFGPNRAQRVGQSNLGSNQVGPFWAFGIGCRRGGGSFGGAGSSHAKAHLDTALCVGVAMGRQHHHPLPPHCPP